jgi:hypothetical protein
MRERVKLLCGAAGKDKTLLINGGCNIPYDTKPENYRAMIDAILEFGTYDTSIKPMPKVIDSAPKGIHGLKKHGMVTSWEVKSTEIGEIRGDEDLIRKPWEALEKMAYSWIWQWVL